MRISVIGCGYLGAVHAAAIASIGHEVIGIDVDPRRVELLNSGTTPFYEPELGDLLTSGLSSGRLKFSTDISQAEFADVHFIAVGTPQAENGLAADLSYVNDAVDSLIPHAREGSLIVGKSTVPFGTAEALAARLAEHAPQVTLVWNPEFLREGFAVQDTLHPDRLVYGVPDGPAGVRATEILDRVYSEARRRDTPLIVTDYATAELVKVAANAFLATKISFINAMAEISEVAGADVTQLADALGHDARIGRRFLNAGVGFGGGCLPKDIRAFAARAEELGLERSVAFLHDVDATNQRQRERVVQIALDAFSGDISGRKVTVLGASFKPNSDDVRDSPALDVAVSLHSHGALVTVTDPQGTVNARARFPELSYTENVDEALTDAEIVLVLTEWQEYQNLDPAHVRRLLDPSADPLVIDGRNCLDAQAWRAAGWSYRGLGR